MQYRYILRIAGSAPEDVAKVLGRASSDDAREWNLVLHEGPDDGPVPFVDLFLKILGGHFMSLERIGASRNNITIWLLYEYDEQCNLEVSAEDMKRLGDQGITLCISCWQKGKESNTNGTHFLDGDGE